MRQIRILSSIILLVLVSCLTLNQFDDVLKKQGFIETNTGWGSAVYLNNHYILTANHLFESKAKVTFMGQVDSNLQFVYRRNDLLLLKTHIELLETPTKMADVGIGDDVYWVQSIPHGDSIKRLWFHGNVALVNDSLVFVDRQFYAGASGSGLYDISGNLVALVSRYQLYENGLAFGIAEIPKFPLFLQTLIDGGVK